MNLQRVKGWHDLTVSEWKELRFLNISDFDSVTDYQIERISVVLDIDSEADFWDTITVKEFSNLVEQFKWLDGQPKREPSEKIGEYFYKGFKSLTLGEYIDLEYWHVEGFVENIERIAAIMYRKQKVGEWGEKIVEPYNKYNRAERAEEFKNLKINEIYGVVVEFLNFRHNFQKKYESIFSDPAYSEEQEDLTEEERITLAGEFQKNKEKKQKHWAWEVFIYDLLKRDLGEYLIKYKDILQVPLIFLFNSLGLHEDFKE